MKPVQIQALPPNLIELLEEKHKLGGKLGPKGAKIWNELMPQMIQMFVNLRMLASHEELQKTALALGETLDFLQKNIGEPAQSKEFTGHCFRAYALMDQYIKQRGQLNTSRLPAVDRLIHAIQAHLLGNLHEQALDTYAGEAKRSIDDLVMTYKNVSENLEEATRKAFLMGIDSITQAFQELQNKDYKNAVVNLRNGAVLLEHLGKWKEEIEAEGQSPIPIVGDDVNLMLEQLSTQGQISPELLHSWVENRFWDLQERWAKVRHDLFMSRVQKDRIVERLDNLMLNLRDLDQHQPRVQEQLLQNLIVQYESLSTCGFQVEQLKEHPAPWLVDLITAILAKGVPRFKIEETIEDFRDSDYHPYAVMLGKYLAEGDRDYLLDALSQVEAECIERQKLPD